MTLFSLHMAAWGDPDTHCVMGAGSMTLINPVMQRLNHLTLSLVFPINLGNKNRAAIESRQDGKKQWSKQEEKGARMLIGEWTVTRRVLFHFAGR